MREDFLTIGHRRRRWAGARSVPFFVACIAAVAIAAFGPALPAQAWTLKTLYSFCGQAKCADGEEPSAGLVQDSAGNLYGTTPIGGANGNGVVFELSPSGGNWQYKVLHDFCGGCDDGSFPSAGLILDANGNLYGTTVVDGSGSDCGLVYRLSPNADRSKWKESILYQFACAPDGNEPSTRLTYQGAAAGAPYDGVSPLYGATSLGGTTDRGAVYELRPTGHGWKESVLYSLCPEGGTRCNDSDGPSGDLLLDASGNLYGLASLGGASNAGTAYELSPEGKKWRESVLYGFCKHENCTDGTGPVGPMAMDAAGNLFGTAVAAASEGGVIFRLAPHGKRWRENVVHTFCLRKCTDGYLPSGGVIVDPSGNLLGTDALGGTGNQGIGGGTIFSVSGKELTTLYEFCSAENCTDGLSPESPLIRDAAGNLYGTTVFGGSHDFTAGTVFELSP